MKERDPREQQNPEKRESPVECDLRIAQLRGRTPSHEELFDLLRVLKPIKGSRLRRYRSKKLQRLAQSILDRTNDITAMPRTHGLRKLVGALQQITMVDKGLQIDITNIAPPLTKEEFLGLLGKIQNFPEDGIKAIETSLNQQKTPSMVPRRFGIRKIYTGVLPATPSLPKPENHT